MSRQPKTPLGLAHTSLRDQVRLEIRNRIVKGQLPPGSKMVERELADELGVSRVPVREALRMLESEGFVHVVPRRGVVVKHLSQTDVQELFDVREALEAFTARRAAEQASKADMRRLKRHLDKASRAAAASNVDDFGDANVAFHDEITAIAGNHLLGTILEPLHGRLDWLFRQVDDPERLCTEHTRLYEAIASGDSAAAAAFAVEHVTSSRKTALRILFGTSPTATAGPSPNAARADPANGTPTAPGTTRRDAGRGTPSPHEGRHVP
ncbi:GntR family transcriptional regulator [Nonomuraea sp. NPDC049028]|uniref:GntR family transcriptional regulator n=1 Tax=Nonomuraea sp. NPDC049028 TaxID=3364348 RepID=UPI0037237112